MRVLIAAHGFQVGRTFGAETYFRSLLGGLATTSAALEVVVLVSRQAVPWVRQVAPRSSIVTAKISGGVVVRALVGGHVVRHAVKHAHPDVVFFPFNLVSRVSMPTVVMVHDLVGCFYRDRFPAFQPMRNAALCWLVRRSITASSIAVVPSRSVQEEIRNYPELASKRVHVVPEAAHPPVDGWDRPGRAYDWNEQFILLQTGSKSPHKNQDLGVRALKYLRSADPGLAAQTRLVLTGCSQQDVSDLNKALDAETRVTMFGRVSTLELERLTRLAAAAVFPTIYEGFGLGIVEAQLRGTPVIASDIPVLREVSGGHAAFFAPGDPQSLGEAMRSVLVNRELQTSLEMGGKAHAMGRTWQHHVEELVDVWIAAKESSGRR